MLVCLELALTLWSCGASVGSPLKRGEYFKEVPADRDGAGEGAGGLAQGRVVVVVVVLSEKWW